MRILALSAQVPYPPHHGKAMRDYHLLAGLARGHDVRLLCMARSHEEIEAAAPLRTVVPFDAVPLPAHTWPRRLGGLLAGRPDLAVRTDTPYFRALLASELQARPPDVLLVEGLEMAGYAFGRRRNTFGGCFPVVLDEHNAEYLLQRRAAEVAPRSARGWGARLYSRLQAGRLARFEARACRAATAVVAVSSADRAALLEIAPQARVAVVPNGVDTRYYAPLALPPNPRPTLVFTGRMDFRPNVDAVQWFCADVWPRIRAALPEAVFRIVGRDPLPAVRALAQEPGVEVLGTVPDDRPYIGGADLYVLPMRFGGGIRLKLLQALAMARAVVSTPLGAEGVEGLADGEHLVLAEGAAAFAARAVELLRDPAARARLGQAGRALVVAGYDWEVLVPRFAAVLEEAGGWKLEVGS